MIYSLQMAALLSLAAIPGGGSLQIPGILDSTQLADGLDIATLAEQEAYRQLATDPARRRFRTLFWTRRDPDPETFDNPVRWKLIERALLADVRYGTRKVRGRDTNRGKVFTLLGEPTRIDVSKRYERFYYAETACGGTAEIVFADVHGDGVYDFAEPEAAAAILAAARGCLIASPMLTYRDRERSLPAPVVAGVEWEEMTAAKKRYEKSGREPDFPLHATLNFVRAGRKQATAFLDIDLVGKEIVMDRQGAGPSRHVQVAAEIMREDGRVAARLRDLSILESREATDRVRIPFDIEPGRYRLTLIAHEPLLSLLSFRSETFTIPDFDLPRIAASSLIVGRTVPTNRASSDIPSAFRAGKLVVRPDDLPATPARPWTALIHAYGFQAPAAVICFIDGLRVDPVAVRRTMRGDAQIIAITPEASGRRVVIMLSDPAAGSALMVGRRFGNAMASQMPRLSELQQDASGTPKAMLLSPKRGANPVTVKEMEAEPASPDASVAFFVDETLEGIRLRSPYRYPVRFQPGRNEMRRAVGTLTGLADGRPAISPGGEVALVSRTPTFHVRTSLVPVYASVTDLEQRRFVADLPKNAFRLEDNGRPQELTHFEPDTEDPIVVAFLQDESPAMAPLLPAARTALAGFAARLRPIDRGFAVGFGRKVALRSDITSCKGCLVGAILGATVEPPSSGVDNRTVTDRPPYGRLMDALEAAIFRLASQGGRKILFVATHGNDGGSRIGLSRVQELARRYGVMIYAIGLNIQPGVTQDELDAISTDPRRRERFFKALGFNRPYAKKDSFRLEAEKKWRGRLAAASIAGVMAAASGGRAYLFDVSQGMTPNLEPPVAELWNELNHQYFLGYDSPGEGPGLHEIQLSVVGYPYEVRSRIGYYGE